MYDAIVRAAESGHRPVLIGTAAPAPEYGIGEDDFAALARAYGCPFFDDARINTGERISQAKASGAPVAISVNWPIVIGREFRDVFRHGIVNAHAGDLPRYRGNACPNWAILAGEPRAFATLHLMGDGIDDGPILLQQSMALTDETYITDVYRFLDKAIPSMFVALLDGLAAGRIRPHPQAGDPALALRCFPRRESDSEIDWNRPAAEVARLVRGSAEPFAGAYSWLDGRRVRIWRARPEQLSHAWHGVPGQIVSVQPGESISVLCADGVLVVDEIETAEAGRARPGRLIRSTRARFGLDVSAEIASLRKRIEALESRLLREGK